MNKDLVSIIVPCYNQAQYLTEALQSVLKQSYTYWECIIVNDGSLDQTAEVAQQWVVKDSRFKYIEKENGGLSSARNAGLNVAAGKYIQFLDSDDFLMVTKLEKAIDTLLKDNVEIVVSNFEMFTNDHSQTTRPFCVLKTDYLNYESILFKWDVLFSIPIHCGIFHQSCFVDFRFPVELKAKEDWVMWISIFKNNPKSSFIPDTLVLYRLHANSMTQDPVIMQDNFLNALLYLKKKLKDTDFDRLLVNTIGSLKNIIGKLNNEISLEKTKFRSIKDSNTYKLGYKIRCFLENIKVLRIAKLVLKKIV